MSKDAEKRVKSILNYLSPSLLSSLMPFITLPIMTRFLKPEDFGIIALTTSFPSLIISIIGCNIDVAAQRYYFEYRKDFLKVSSLINSTTAFLFFVYIVSSLFIFANQNLFSQLIMGNPEYGFAIFIAYVTACLNILVTFYLTMYRDMERPKIFSRFTITQMIMNASLILVFVAVLGFGYIGVIYGSFLATLSVFCMLFWKFQKEFPFCFNFIILKDNFKYGIPLLGNYLSGPVSQFLDKYLLRSIVSLSSAGIYSVAQNISRKIFEFMTSIQSTYHPIFMKDMFDHGKKAAVSIGRNFTVFTYLSLSAVLGMILFGEEIIHILAPSSYYGTINVMLIILCGISMQTFGKIVGIPLAYVKKAYLSVPITFVEVTANILLNLLFIPLWGAIGAGLATAATIFISNSVYMIVSQKYYYIRYEKKILVLFYLNIFASAIALIIFRKVEAPLLVKYCFKIISLVLFVVLGIKSQILTKVNIKAVLSIFMPKKVLLNI